MAEEAIGGFFFLCQMPKNRPIYIFIPKIPNCHSRALTVDFTRVRAFWEVGFPFSVFKY